MHVLSSPARVTRLALLASVGVLIASCVAPGGPQGGSGARVERVGRSAPSPAAEPKYSFVVTELRGRAWVQRDGQPSGLKDGASVGENQPIQVGARSILRMQLGDQALFELAPNTRMVVHQLPRDGRGDARATWLRIEQGYLRVQWKGALMDPPMQVSFGIWAARLKPGEYFFDTRGRVAAACAASGSMRLSGVPEWTPQGPLQECLKLEANKSPLAIAMTDAQWSAVRSQRRLHPTLAQAARNRSKAAIARLEREQVRSPGPRPPAPEPVAQAPAIVAPPPVAAAPRTAVPSTRGETPPPPPRIVEPPPPAPAPPPVAVIPAPAPSPAPRGDDDDATRERTADELIREAEEVRDAARPAPKATLPPANPKMLPAPAPSVALGPSPPAAPATPLPGLTRRPAPIVPPPPPAPAPPPSPPAVTVVPPAPPAPPPPEPAYEVVEPARTAQRSPPVIVIPAEPEPEPSPPPPPPAPPPEVAVVPPAPPPPPSEPAYEVVEPPQTAQRSPPVIVIPAEPEPAPVPEPAPPPPPPAPAPPPPAVAMAPPAPPPVETPTPRSPPVITIPAEPEPEPQPVTPPPSAPSPRAAPPPSSVELAEQSPVVIPPSTQPPVSDSGPRAPGSATPPSVPLDVAMYSVAAMPDKIGASESALIVPPTITHEPANSQWLVNIASYPTIDAARDHARMLVKQKLRAGVREQALPDRMSYLVVIEGYPTEEAAETAAIDLEAHFDLDPY